MAGKWAKGKCFICKKVYTKSGMTNHLKSHLRKERKDLSLEKTDEYFHLSIISDECPDFWLHVGALTSSRLWEIDAFLRKIWFYSDSHLSGFTIDDISYDVNGVDRIDNSSLFGFMGIERRSMNYKASDILKPGVEFLYEYDFGTTSRVKIGVKSKYEDSPDNQSIALLARNELPEYPCEKCEKPVEVICGEIYEQQWLCRKCAAEEDLLDFSIPFENTPRIGLY
jgi:hypothetical protein